MTSRLHQPDSDSSPLEKNLFIVVNFILNKMAKDISDVIADIREFGRKHPELAKAICSAPPELDHVLTDTTEDGEKVPLSRPLPPSARKYALTGVWAPKKEEEKQDYQR